MFHFRNKNIEPFTPDAKGGFWRVFVRELGRMAHDPLYAFCMVVAPVLIFIFFISLMWEGLPTDMPVGLVDEDNTATTRMIVRNLDAMEETKIVETYPSVTEAREAIQRGDIYAFYYIPKGTTIKANRQEQPTVSYYATYSYLVAGSLIGKDFRMMSELASAAASRKVLRARGQTDTQALAFIQPIVIDTHATNNPWLNYNVYLSNIIIPAIFGIFLYMITVYSIGHEIKFGTAHDWIVKSKNNMFNALLGKLLPQTIIFMLTGAAIIFFLYGYLKFPCNCPISSMMIVMFLFIIASQGLGVLFITLIPTLRLGLSNASLWGVVSISICGFTYPTMGMHWTLEGLSVLFPLRHYFILYVNCALDGYEIMNAWPYVLFLIVFASLPIFCAKWLKHQLLTVKYIP